MKLFQGLALVMIWVIGLPLTIGAAFATSWSGTGGIDSGDAPSTAASLAAWLVGFGGFALMIAASVAVSRLDQESSDEWPSSGWTEETPEQTAAREARRRADDEHRRPS